MNVLEIAITKGLIIEGESTANAIAKVEAFATEIVAQQDKKWSDERKKVLLEAAQVCKQWASSRQAEFGGNALTNCGCELARMAEQTEGENL
jgi:hypothetical protein